MASSDAPGQQGTSGGEFPYRPGQPTTVESQVLDMGARMVQAMKPVKQIKQHACTFALCSHDPSRPLETHHFASRLNEDLLQCAVYDSDHPAARLIGVEYIVSGRLFETLPEEERRLWHSHSHEIREELWVHLRVPELLVRPELELLRKL